MGVKYNIKGDVGIIAEDGNVSNNIITQKESTKSEAGFEPLLKELLDLKAEIIKISNKKEKAIAVSRITEAEAAAKEGNKEKVIKALKGIGKWTGSVATSISAKLAAEAISNIIKIP